MPPGVVVVNDVARVIDPDGHNAVVEDRRIIYDDEDVSSVIVRPGSGELQAKMSPRRASARG